MTGAQEAAGAQPGPSALTWSCFSNILCTNGYPRWLSSALQPGGTRSLWTPGWGCAQLPGTAGHFLPTQAIQAGSQPPNPGRARQGPPTQGPGAPCPTQHRVEASLEPECHSRWAKVVSCQLQRVSIAKAPQDGPRGLVAASLDEERVQEKEACSGMQRTEWHRAQPGLAHPRPLGRKGVRPHRPESVGRHVHLPPRFCSPPSSRLPGPVGQVGAQSRMSVSKRKWLLVGHPLPLS